MDFPRVGTVASDLRDQLQASLGEAYLLERELGGGGMSRVFLARETALGRQVVVKVLLPELSVGVSADRFRREIQLAAHLQHPHIVPLLSAGESYGLPYFTMPFVVGESLGARIARDGELPVAETVRILRDVASALAYAHHEGVVHRDIKPDNVLLSHGVAVVTDFGVAKALTVSAESRGPLSGNTGLTSLGIALGTPTYMAPEQASADPGMDHRVDIYAFGVVAYEMLTGRPPFAARSPQAMLGAHVAVLPEPVARYRPMLPLPLATLVMHCLEKRPADRPQTAGDILQTLDFMTTPSGGTTPIVALPPSQHRGRRIGRQAVRIALGALGVAAVGVLGYQLSRLTAGEHVEVAPPPIARAAPVSAQLELPPAPDTAAPDTATTERAAAPPSEPPARPRPRIATPSPERREPAPAATVAAPIDTAALVDSARIVTRAADSAPPTPVRPPPAETVAAEASPTPAAPPAPDPRQEIRRLVATYAAAIESRSIDAIRRAYPGLTDGQARGWGEFFEAVAAIEVGLEPSVVELADDSAEVLLSGLYVYENASTRRTVQQPVTFRASFRRSQNGWRLSAIR